MIIVKNNKKACEAMSIWGGWIFLDYYRKIIDFMFANEKKQKKYKARS